MRRRLIIPSLLVASILFSAKSCYEDTEENRRMEEEALIKAMDSVKDEFGAEFLHEESLFAFEQKAKQKLRDYADYLSIATSDTLDMAFRAQADSMIRDLFMPGCIPGIPQKGPVKLSLDSIYVFNPLHRSGRFEYRGTLSFVQHTRNLSGDKSILRKPEQKMIEIFAVRQVIPIDTDTLVIWKVLLGDIH